MKATVRTTTAAAILMLAPVAATFVATPAAAQSRWIVAQQNAVVAQRLHIERFVVRGGHRIEPGRELRFRLQGTPGGVATVVIPGVTNRLVLDENNPGQYEGSYTVRRRDNLEAFDRAVASLQVGNRRVTAQAEVDRAGRDRYADDRGPRVSDMKPGPGDRVDDDGRTRISAKIEDNGSGVDRSSIRLLVDGQDVTGQSRIDGDEVRFRENLRRGRHTAELVVRDRAGNLTRKAWSFDVVDRDRPHAQAQPQVQLQPRPMPVVVPLQVTSHTNNAVIDAAGSLTIYGQAEPHANVRIQIEAVNNGVAQGIGDYTVVANGTGLFTATVQPRGGRPAPGTRYDVRVTSSSEGKLHEQRIALFHRRG